MCAEIDELRPLFPCPYPLRNPLILIDAPPWYLIYLSGACSKLLYRRGRPPAASDLGYRLEVLERRRDCFLLLQLRPWLVLVWRYCTQRLGIGSSCRMQRSCVCLVNVRRFLCEKARLVTHSFPIFFFLDCISRILGSTKANDNVCLGVRKVCLVLSCGAELQEGV